MITDPLVIDGYSQPGASPNTLSQGDDAVSSMIELDGTRAGGWRNWSYHYLRRQHSARISG